MIDLYSDVVPTMGLVEENMELRAKVALYELRFGALQVTEVATAMMMVDQGIELAELGCATFDELGPMEIRRYHRKSERLIAAIQAVHNDDGL